MLNTTRSEKKLFSRGGEAKLSASNGNGLKKLVDSDVVLLTVGTRIKKEKVFGDIVCLAVKSS